MSTQPESLSVSADLRQLDSSQIKNIYGKLFALEKLLLQCTVGFCFYFCSGAEMAQFLDLSPGCSVSEHIKRHHL